LKEIGALVAARDALLANAAKHQQTIIPAYTHGVQAQPTTYAHYLLALASMLARETARLIEVYRRINRSPLGTAALATSSFPLDRNHLCASLGFDSLLENAYDANHLAPVDSALEVAAALSIAAVQIGQFAQDIHAQYAEAVPWFVLGSGELTGVSSIMPQKRNPAALEQLRAQSSLMLADMHSVTLISHNTRIGMFDYRMYDPVPSARPLLVLDLFTKVVNGLVVNKERALAEVRADYSTTTEIADALLQRANVPFRIGHHFASQLTDYGRGKGLKLQEIPYTDAARIYEDGNAAKFPLTAADFAEVISAEYMVFGRRGIGGPQVKEIERMLDAERAQYDSDRSTLGKLEKHVSDAAQALQHAFDVLAT
jgi:argininosuccinate lyase